MDLGSVECLATALITPQPWMDPQNLSFGRLVINIPHTLTPLDFACVLLHKPCTPHDCSNSNYPVRQTRAAVGKPQLALHDARSECVRGEWWLGLFVVCSVVVSPRILERLGKRYYLTPLISLFLDSQEKPSNCCLFCWARMWSSGLCLGGSVSQWLEEGEGSRTPGFQFQLLEAVLSNG